MHHIFSPPLKLCMLRTIRCRIQPNIEHNNHSTIPLSMAMFKDPYVACSLNQSQYNVETLRYKCMSSIIHKKKHPSLIAIDIGNNEPLQEPTIFRHVNQSTNFDFPIDQLKLNNKIYLSRHSLVKLNSSYSCVSISSRCDQHHHHHYRRNRIFRCLSLFTSSIHKRKNDSIVFSQRSLHNTNHWNDLISNQRLLSEYSPRNINSITYESSSSNDTTINISKSNSDILTPTNKNIDKTWRLQIQDHLNKDGSRHAVIHKGSESSVSERRKKKHAKRSEEKKRKIEEKIYNANQRWQKYSTIDYELVLFISRYYDQLPLCSNCRNYFVTNQTQFLADDPRASYDYAAEAVLLSSSNKTLTMKKAAKARLIKDYDKQTNVIFNLCDTCLVKCEQIRNELKQINSTKKISNETNSPYSEIMNIKKSYLQQPIGSPYSPNISNVNNHLFSPSTSPMMSPSTWSTDLNHQQQVTSISSENRITDLNEIYMNNIIQYHQINLRQLYQQSQNIISAQQYQEDHSLAMDQQKLHHELQSCIRQMQYHYLEILHLQYPGCSLSFPYAPLYDPKYLSYRFQEDKDRDDSVLESSSSTNGQQYDYRSNVNIEVDSNTTSKRSGTNVDNYYTDKNDRNEPMLDDRLTIETCHGLVEYYNAPLDDFIRGLEVLKCLSIFNRYPS
ncbi:unnamed protein product [Rotaria magnacalcarata]